MSCRPILPPANATDEARRHVRRLRQFYHHLLIFVLVNCGLAAINLLTNPAHLWFVWPLLGWGLWLAIHGVALLTRGFCFDGDWEERKVQEYLTRKQPRAPS